MPGKFLGQISPTLEYDNSRGTHGQHPHSQFLALVSCFLQIITITHTNDLQEIFPFFPLSTTFDPFDSHSWQLLTSQIQLCLMQEMEEHPAYLWVHEFFWMVFVAAFPRFPYGDWPNWNPRISMDHDFISHWIADINIGEIIPESARTACDFIWEELKGLAACILPVPVVLEPFT